MATKIESVVRSGLCIGCGACASDVISNPARMQVSSAGYLRPVFNSALSVEDESRIGSVCPAISLKLNADPHATQHLHWGPLVGVRTGWAANREVRFRGSSGGGISALLIYLLESGKANFVAHVGVSVQAPLTNERRISRTREDVLAAAGSRYAPAAPLVDVHQLFVSGERFAFVGKPCDVAAFRQYVELNPHLRSQVVAVISFMCAGVPSFKGTHELLNALGTDASEVVRFQYRGNGWPGFATAVTEDGRSFTMDYNKSWGQILGRHLQLRCKLCPDGTGEFADVVCADAWHGKDGYPDFDEREGRSLVLSRTAVGEALVMAAVGSDYLVVETLDPKEISLMQPYQLTRKQVVLGRWVAVWLRTAIFPHFAGLGLFAALREGGLVPVLRNAWGTFKRIRAHGD